MRRRTRARQRPLPRPRLTDSSKGLSAWGPYVYDHVSGTLREKRKCVRQRGGWVSADWKDGTRDEPVKGEGQ
jgi:hypothetical protein